MRTESAKEPTVRKRNWERISTRFISDRDQKLVGQNRDGEILESTPLGDRRNHRRPLYRNSDCKRPIPTSHASPPWPSHDNPERPSPRRKPNSARRQPTRTSRTRNHRELLRGGHRQRRHSELLRYQRPAIPQLAVANATYQGHVSVRRLYRQHANTRNGSGHVDVSSDKLWNVVRCRSQ